MPVKSKVRKPSLSLISIYRNPHFAESQSHFTEDTEELKNEAFVSSSNSLSILLASEIEVLESGIIHSVKKKCNKLRQLEAQPMLHGQKLKSSKLGNKIVQERKRMINKTTQTEERFSMPSTRQRIMKHKFSKATIGKAFLRVKTFEEFVNDDKASIRKRETDKMSLYNCAYIYSKYRLFRYYVHIIRDLYGLAAPFLLIVLASSAYYLLA